MKHFLRISEIGFKIGSADLGLLVDSEVEKSITKAVSLVLNF